MVCVSGLGLVRRIELEERRRHGWMTPDRTAEEVNEALQAKDEDWAFKLNVQPRDQLAEMLENEDPAGWLLRSRPLQVSSSDPATPG
jgi:hypothetical protein